jgi:hypothetical protein
MMTRNTFLSALAVALMLVAVGYTYSQRPQAPTPSLVQRCTDLGGEWLYNSDDKICTFPNGEWLAYSLSQDKFVPRDQLKRGLPQVLAASEDTALVPEVHTCAELLEAEAYSVEEAFDGSPQVDFSTYEAARHYRTAISQDVARGVNFAGRYVVSTWGCGQGCVGSAVVNAETGKILSYGLISSGYIFEVNSRLLDAEREGYYVVEGDELVKICE